MNRLSWLIMLALGACVVTACGDDDDSDSDKDAGPDSGDGKDTDSGAGGTGGMMGGGSGGFGIGMPVSVECGTSTCTGDAISSFLAPPCCLDEEAGTCGMSSGGNCMAMPEPDTRCPSVNLAGIINAAGCCTDDDQCGVSGTIFGAGCTSLEQLSGGGNGAGGSGGGIPGFIMFPAPRSCSGEEPDAGTEPTEDAGT